MWKHLDIADRQNAHFIALSVRGVVNLFRFVNREAELHRHVLAFSVSHDHRDVRIYGHYPVINGERTTYYRHSIRQFNFTELNGKERWTSYKFVMGVYSDWASSHFKRLCSAIDELQAVDFDMLQQPETPHQPEVLHQLKLSFSKSTGLSQGAEGVDIQGSSATSLLKKTGAAPQNTPSGAPEKKSAEAFKVPGKIRRYY